VSCAVLGSCPSVSVHVFVRALVLVLACLRACVFLMCMQADAKRFALDPTLVAKRTLALHDGKSKGKGSAAKKHKGKSKLKVKTVPR